ncbi:hypothetical protein F0562_032061 [Nyssa sinensis]|uniref:Uncharacterized protein n=1 Tax=Nyssa sinensis TaxID=561372 RepID=A0A5J5AW20_9ASTE|nr:hypothetical protein F0562_032061 [Nyssa sinensis]
MMMMMKNESRKELQEPDIIIKRQREYGFKDILRKMRAICFLACLRFGARLTGFFQQSSDNTSNSSSLQNLSTNIK